MSIGEKITLLRKKKGLTQEKLAESVGVSRQTLSNWESNITSPDLSQAKKLCQLLRLSLDDLMCNDLEVVCQNKQNNLIRKLIGKTCYLNIDDDFFDLDLTYNTPVKILAVEDDFIKIEYNNKKEKLVKLIDVDLVVAIKVVEEI